MRISTHIMIYIIMLNVTVGMADGAGVWDDWGLDVEAGVQDEVEDARDVLKETGQAGGFGGQTLIGAFLFAKEVLETAWAVVFALPAVMDHIGIPLIGQAINAIVPIIVGKNVLEVLTGRRV